MKRKLKKIRESTYTKKKQQKLDEDDVSTGNKNKKDSKLEPSSFTQELIEDSGDDSDREDDFDADEDIEEESTDEEDEDDDFDDNFDIEYQQETEKDTEDKSVPLTNINKKNLYKPPTNDELNELKETENLYHSSLFRMQITELLSEIKVKAKRRRQMENVFNTIKEYLVNIPAGKPHELADQTWLQKKVVKVPFLQSPEHVKGRFQFCPPSDVQIVGSLLSGTCVKPNVILDIAVTMPKDCLQNKDNLNQRYLRKRALYLSVIATHLRKKAEVEELKFAYHHGNRYKPILVLEVKGDQGKPITVHIHVVPEDGVFKLNRFHIKKNNVRRQWYLGYTGETEDDEGNQPATPMYNTAVLEDMTLLQNTEHLVGTLAESQGLQEGIALLKVWLRQRELDVGYGGFSSYILSMYVSYLLSNRQLNKMMSSYQVFRNTLLNLSKSNWTSEGISLCKGDLDSQRPLLSEFLEAFDVVFVDVTGYVNLCANMNKSCFNRVHYEAKLAFHMLEDHTSDSFSSLFMTPLPFLRTFDNIFHIRDLTHLRKSVKKFGLSNQEMDRGGDFVATVTSRLVEVLQRALERRVMLIQIKQEHSKQWSINESPPRPDSQQQITVGLLLNPETFTSILDKGPVADAPEAKDFREFWGEKSQLRRFKDGSICEAVAWMESNTTLSRKRTVCSELVKHILNRQAGISEESIFYVGCQLDSVLHLPAKFRKVVMNYGTGEEEALAIIRSYDSLCKSLRGLSDLPLTINSIQGISPVFRYTEVFPAIPATYKTLQTTVKDTDGVCPHPTKECPPYTPALKIVCMMEGSGKWPEKREPFRRLKAAFHLNLAKILSSQQKLQVIAMPDYVDVKKDNYIFRIELAHKREIALAKMHHTPEGMMKMRDTEDSVQLEKQIVILPKLTSTLHGLQQQHNTFSGAVRLAKRWVACQLLGDHIRGEAIELIMAQLYISPHPFSVPNSPLVGFLRFLHLLSSHDWKGTPLMVNLNQEFTAGDYAEISSRFSKERSQLPLMFISTPDDKYSSHWTSGLPTAPILQRLLLLAKESLHVLESQLESCNGSQEDDFKQIFRPPLDIYDAIIYLKQKQTARQNQALDINKDTFIPVYGINKNHKVLPVYEYDPIQLYLSDLRAAYEDYALFFNDCYGGNFIAVLWKPNIFTKGEFKVSHIGGKMPVIESNTRHSDVQMMPNIAAIIEDFRVLGGGLVSGIETRSEKWTSQVE